MATSYKCTTFDIHADELYRVYLNQLTKDRHTLSAAIVIILETVFDDLSLNIGK